MEPVDIYLTKAFEAKQQDLRDVALGYFIQAAAEEPEDIEILIELAKSQIDCGLKANARKTLNSALKLDCDDLELLLDLSRVLRLAGATDQAIDLYHQVGRHRQYSAQATLEAVMLLERQHQLDEAKELVSHSRASKNAPQIKLAKGLLAERRGDADQARQLYRQVWHLKTGDLSVEAGYRLARLLDRSDRSDEAMKILMACKKAEKAKMPVSYLADFVNHRRAQDRGIVASLPKDWFQACASTDSTRKSLFVLGHPRSGTTLLAKLLASKCRMAWVDESPAFDIMGQQLVSQKENAAGAEGFIRMLQNTSSQEIDQFEKAYHTRMTGELDGSEHILLDKNPGLSTSFPALARLLPHSPWVFLMRDPRDVALSCYFQRLGNTPLGYCSLTLEGALEAVLHVQSYWKSLRSLLPPSRAVELKYEDLVREPDRLIDSVAKHLGYQGGRPEEVGGREAALPLLESPTYADIQQPVHDTTTRRWMKHQPLFSKKSPLLEEILEAWGYAS